MYRKGRVDAINIAYLPPPQTGAESIGFSIPADTVTSFADQLINSGRLTNPYLGVLNLRGLTPELARQFGLSVDRGVIVPDVERGGPADEAGLRQGDVITALNSERIEDTGDLLGALRDQRPGDQVALTVVRGGTGGEEEVTVELGERPRRQR